MGLCSLHTHFPRGFSPHGALSFLFPWQLADLNKRLPAEACLPPAKPVSRSQRYERQPAMRPATPHTITLQPSSFRNLRLPKRLRVIYFFARTRLAQRLIMVRRVVVGAWSPFPLGTNPTQTGFQKSHKSPFSCVPTLLRGSYCPVVNSSWDPSLRAWLCLH